MKVIFTPLHLCSIRQVDKGFPPPPKKKNKTKERKKKKIFQILLYSGSINVIWFILITLFYIYQITENSFDKLVADFQLALYHHHEENKPPPVQSSFNEGFRQGKCSWSIWYYTKLDPERWWKIKQRKPKSTGTAHCSFTTHIGLL